MKRTSQSNGALFRVRLHLCKQLGAFLLDPSAFRTVRISPRAVATLICGVRLDAVNLAFERNLLRSGGGKGRLEFRGDVSSHCLPVKVVTLGLFFLDELTGSRR